MTSNLGAQHFRAQGRLELPAGRRGPTGRRWRGRYWPKPGGPLPRSFEPVDGTPGVPPTGRRQSGRHHPAAAGPDGRAAVRPGGVPPGGGGGRPAAGPGGRRSGLRMPGLCGRAIAAQVEDPAATCLLRGAVLGGPSRGWWPRGPDTGSASVAADGERSPPKYDIKY